MKDKKTRKERKEELEMAIKKYEPKLNTLNHKIDCLKKELGKLRIAG